ncbi:MAG: 2-amino-4-hydroxy-6-hydroxymethyldihydropteridine diphosphokinase [Pseudohongiellaceae bacterium]
MHDPAIVALGANLPGRSGSPERAVREAMQRLSALSVVAPRCSSLWRSRPVDCPPGSPDFINAVVALQPAEGTTPLELLGQLQQLEQAFGRQHGGGRNAPRVLDLDLIAWGARCSETAQLELPHPRAHDRAFVLMPFAEVAPDLVFPGQKESVRTLAATCSGKKEVFRCQGIAGGRWVC